MNFRPYTTTELLNDEELSVLKGVSDTETPGFFIVGGENPTKQVSTSLALLNFFEQTVDTFEVQRSFFWWTKKTPAVGIFLNDDEESFEKGEIYKTPVDKTNVMVETLARRIQSYQAKNIRTTGYFDTPSFGDSERSFRDNLTAEQEASEQSLWRAISETENGNMVFFHYLSDALVSAENTILNASIDCSPSPQILGSLKTTAIPQVSFNLQNATYRIQ